MNKTRNPRFYASTLMAAFALLAALSLLLVAGCKKGEAGGKPADVDYYTCTMHPSVKSQDPKAKCPICSMDLVPVMKKGAAGMNSTNAMSADMERTGQMSNTNSEDKPGEFTVPIQRQQMIGVTYAVIQKQPFTHSVRAVGMVAYDKQRHWDYVARVEGYVKNLSVFSRGELVEKNAPILTIYSPDLLTTQREFVSLLTMQDDARTKGNHAVL